MTTVNAALNIMNQLAEEPESVLPATTVRDWMQSADLQLRGIAYYVLFDPKYHRRIEPKLSLRDYIDFVLPLYETCLRHDPDVDWIPTRYTAGWDLANWFKALWQDKQTPRGVLKEIKDWLAHVYMSSDQAVRDAIITAFLEHVFEKKGIVRFFSDWKVHPELADAVQDALGTSSVE